MGETFPWLVFCLPLGLQFSVFSLGELLINDFFARCITLSLLALAVVIAALSLLESGVVLSVEYCSIFVTALAEHSVDLIKNF